MPINRICKLLSNRINVVVDTIGCAKMNNVSFSARSTANTRSSENLHTPNKKQNNEMGINTFSGLKSIDSRKTNVTKLTKSHGMIFDFPTRFL